MRELSHPANRKGYHYHWLFNQHVDSDSGGDRSAKSTFCALNPQVGRDYPTKALQFCKSIQVASQDETYPEIRIHLRHG